MGCALREKAAERKESTPERLPEPHVRVCVCVCVCVCARVCVFVCVLFLGGSSFLFAFFQRDTTPGPAIFRDPGSGREGRPAIEVGRAPAPGQREELLRHPRPLGPKGEGVGQNLRAAQASASSRALRRMPPGPRKRSTGFFFLLFFWFYFLSFLFSFFFSFFGLGEPEPAKAYKRDVYLDKSQMSEKGSSWKLQFSVFHLTESSRMSGYQHNQLVEFSVSFNDRNHPQAQRCPAWVRLFAGDAPFFSSIWVSQEPPTNKGRGGQKKKTRRPSEEAIARPGS